MAFETTLPGRYFTIPRSTRANKSASLVRCGTWSAAPTRSPQRVTSRPSSWPGRACSSCAGATALRAFLNVCRHRGARLPGTLWQYRRRHPVHVPRLTYALDGRLIGAPNIARDESSGSREPRSRSSSSQRLGRAHLALTRRGSGSGHGSARARATRPLRRAGEIPAL